MTLPAGTRLGPYEILSPIGAGGMGEVYRAKDNKLGREVAVKVLPEQLATHEESLARFEREARAVAALNHPNILSIHDFGTDNGIAYAITELLEGETLRTKLEEGPLPARRVLDYGVQIARGLAAAHEKGIVHRDLKPDNLFVTKDGRLKILDFGLAKTLAPQRADDTRSPTVSAHTEPGTVMGTVGYMSPEQVKGRTVDHRSDIFSFGAVLYEMAAGRRAFQRDTSAETMTAILREEPPELPGSATESSSRLDRVIRHCVEKDPEQRFQSARDLAFDLEALSGASASGPATTASARTPRNRARLSAVAAASALALVATSYLAGRRVERLSSPSSRTFSQLTYRQEPIFNARFAPDGKTIFYSAAPSGNLPSIYSARPGFPGASAFGSPGTALLSVSSKGELAVLTHAQFIRHDVFTGTLARMPLEGGAPREVLDDVREAEWSPDGSGLAVIREVGGKDRLEFPVGKILREVGGYLSNARFSPKGDQIAFFEHPVKWDDRGLVAVIDLQGSRRTVLSEGYWGEEGLAWSPDGREVLFSAGTAYNNFKVYAVDLAGHRREALQSAGGVTVQDIAQDGRWLVTRDDFLREMPVLAPGQSAEKDLSWLDLSDPVALTPDGKTLLFTESSGSVGVNYATCLRRTDGSPVVRLGEGNAADLSRDGRWALAVVPTSPQQLAVYPTGAGEVRRLDRGNIVSFESARFFPDGSRVLACGSEEGHAVRCYVQSLSGGGPRAVTPEGTSDGYVSPDSKLILARPSSGGLMLYPTEGGAARAVPDAAPDDGVIQWSPDGRSVLVGKPAEIPARIERLDLASGRRTLVRTLGPARLAGALQIGTVAMSEDEKYYAYSTRVMISRLFLVEGAR